MPIEQSALTQLVEECCDHDEVGKNTSMVFGYYNMVGYISQAVGAALAGIFMDVSQNYGFSENEATNAIITAYAVFGLLKFIGYYFMDRAHI